MSFSSPRSTRRSDSTVALCTRVPTLTASDTDAFLATESLDGVAGGRIGRVSLAGGPLVTVVDQLDSPGSFAVDGDTVFVVTRQASGTWALERVHGAERTLVPGGEIVSRNGCVFDSAAIYCSRPKDSGTNADLVRIRRPMP